MCKNKTNWLIYIIRCLDKTLYTGITTDLVRRLNAHANQKGAKYFRGRMPEAVVYLERGHTRSSASKREAEIKKMKPKDKHALIASKEVKWSKPL